MLINVHNRFYPGLRFNAYDSGGLYCGKNRNHDRGGSRLLHRYCAYNSNSLRYYKIPYAQVRRGGYEIAAACRCFNPFGAGAFSVSAPGDLIPELQGRFPLRVELEALKKEDFKRILTEPKNALVKQYEALLGTEGVVLDITEDAIDRMAFIAEDVNSRAENIGARRLHTIMETVLEDLSFSADLHCGETITIDKDYVDERMKNVVQDQNLERYIL